MSNEAEKQGPHGTTEVQVTNLSAEAASAGVALAALTTELVKEAWQAYHARVPLACAVVDSIGQGEDRKVTVELKNQTIHGLYIDNIEVDQHPGSDASPQPQDEYSFGGMKSSAKPLLPCYLSPGATQKIGISFTLPSKLMREMREGKLRVTYVKLDEHKSRTLEVEFLMRGGKPATVAKR